MAKLSGITQIIDAQRNEIDEKFNFGELYKRATEQFINHDCSLSNEDNADFISGAGYKLSSITIVDLEYSDSYFIFSHGSNSYISFRVKECPDWLFGIWWFPHLTGENTGKDISEVDPSTIFSIEGEFFCQYEPEIDKFKPSRSEYCKTIVYDIRDFSDKCLLEEPRFCTTYDHLKIIAFIHDHPELAFCRTYHGYDYNLEYVSEERAKKEFYEYKKEKVDEKVAEESFRKEVYNYYKDTFCKIFDIKDSKIIDRGDCISPRYEILASIESNFTPEEIDELHVKEWDNYYYLFHTDKSPVDLTPDELSDYEKTRHHEDWIGDIERRYDKYFLWTSSYFNPSVQFVSKARLDSLPENMDDWPLEDDDKEDEDI